jgi:ABC-type branched-subunit amino acid transport system substrate-binding protein
MRFQLALAAALLAAPALADDAVTIGMIVPMTGPSQSTGKQEQAGALLYIQQHGDKVAGKTIKFEVKDDGGAADVTKRLAQELVANDHAAVLMGFGLTPLALAVAPIATEAKVPELVTAAATAMITESAEKRHQEGRDHRVGLRTGPRRGKMVRLDLHRRRRNDRRGAARAPEEPGFRPVPAARQG